jgi:co-chaperonin GroES (HSP10)
MLSILVFLVVLSYISTFVSNQRRYSSNLQLLARQRRTQVDEPVISEVTYTPGQDIPEEVLKHQTIYDMILIERINAPVKTAAGIILPVVEGKDQKKTAVIVSMGKGYGLESEQGRLQGMDEIAPYKIGDTVYVQVTMPSNLLVLSMTI